MPPSREPANVIADARWVPTHLDLERGSVEFVWLPREVQSKTAFLTDQYIPPADTPRVQLPLNGIGNWSSPAAPHYIFHSAFCRSTLLARALDAPGSCMALKEPQILNELAELARRRQLAANQLTCVISLLGRPFGPGEQVVIKPSNEANNLAAALLKLRPASKALLLYAPLPSFLAAVVRRGMWGRIWVRRLLRLLLRNGDVNLGFDTDQLLELTDLQVAATAWLHHHAQFHQLLAHHDRVRTLDSETFNKDPAACLQALGRHFGLGLSADRVQAIVQSAVFKEHSKKIGQVFQKDEPDPTSSSEQEEIAMVSEWTAAVAKAAEVPMNFPDPAALLPQGGGARG